MCYSREKVLRRDRKQDREILVSFRSFVSLVRWRRTHDPRTWTSWYRVKRYRGSQI